VQKIVTPYHGIPARGARSARSSRSPSAWERRPARWSIPTCAASRPCGWSAPWGPSCTGFDFVSPLYLRHKYDGTITNSIVYPLTRALYGREVRQPIGGDFGFSGRLASHYLTKPVWESNVARFGIDIWMTTTAIADGFKVCQTFLGAKLHNAKDPVPTWPTCWCRCPRRSST
jgi:hypothetical protein